MVKDYANYNTAEVQRWARQALSHLVNDGFGAEITKRGLVVVPLFGKSVLAEYESPFEDHQVRYKAGRGLPGPYEDIVDDDYGYVTIDAKDVLLGFADEIRLTPNEIEELEARTRQRFLARNKGLENVAPVDDKDEPEYEFTMLPKNDAVARFGIALELPNLLAVAKAAKSIAEFANNDENRLLFANSGALPFLVARLICGDDRAAEASAMALKSLAANSTVRDKIINFGGLKNLSLLLKDENASSKAKVAALEALAETAQLVEAETSGDGKTEEQTQAIVLASSELGKELNRLGVFSTIEDLAEYGDGKLKEKANRLVESFKSSVGQ